MDTMHRNAAEVNDPEPELHPLDDDWTVPEPELHPIDHDWTVPETMVDVDAGHAARMAELMDGNPYLPRDRGSESDPCLAFVRAAHEPSTSDLRDYLRGVMVGFEDDDSDNAAFLYRKLHALLREVEALDATTPEQYEDRKDCMEDARRGREEGWGRAT